MAASGLWCTTESNPGSWVKSAFLALKVSRQRRNIIQEIARILDLISSGTPPENQSGDRINYVRRIIVDLFQTGTPSEDIMSAIEHLSVSSKEEVKTLYDQILWQGIEQRT